MDNFVNAIPSPILQQTVVSRSGASLHEGGMMELHDAVRLPRHPVSCPAVFP